MTPKEMTELENIVRENTKQVAEIWALFRETREQAKETDKRLEQLNENTNQALDKLTHNVNRVTHELESVKAKWGRFVEYILAPGIPNAFAEKGIDIHHTFQRAKRPGIEIDILAVNHDSVVAVEVKSTLGVDDVKHFLKALPKFKESFPEYKDKKVYGAVAGIEITGEADKYAFREGLFVIGQSGESVCIRNSEGFEPKIW